MMAINSIKRLRQLNLLLAQWTLMTDYEVPIWIEIQVSKIVHWRIPQSVARKWGYTMPTSLVTEKHGLEADGYETIVIENYNPRTREYEWRLHAKKTIRVAGSFPDTSDTETQSARERPDESETG